MNADYYDEKGKLVEIIYQGKTRVERHRELIEHAVKGMIPKNRLGRVLLTKLKVFKGPKHDHSAQTPAVLAPAN